MAASLKIWDISQPLRPALPVWPGDTPFQARRVCSYGEGSPVNVSMFTASTHSGAHADAPLHYDPDGEDIAAVSLDAYMGPCLLVDARDSGALIEPDLLDRFDLDDMERVLFRTYAQFPHDRWAEDFTAVHPETIRRLALRGVRLIGLDSPSLDPQESKTMDAHLAVRAAGMRVLEGLVLDAPPAGRYELIALPLPLAGLDAAPVRAVLRELAR